MEAGSEDLLGYEVGAPTAVIEAHGEVNLALQHLALEDQLDGLSHHAEGAGQGVAAGFEVEGQVVGFAARVEASFPLAGGIGRVEQGSQYKQQSRQSGYAFHEAYCIIAGALS